MIMVINDDDDDDDDNDNDDTLWINPCGTTEGIIKCLKNSYFIYLSIS